MQRNVASVISNKIYCYIYYHTHTVCMYSMYASPVSLINLVKSVEGAMVKT